MLEETAAEQSDIAGQEEEDGAESPTPYALPPPVAFEGKIGSGDNNKPYKHAAEKE
jgi:hypothetical protein